MLLFWHAKEGPFCVVSEQRTLSNHRVRNAACAMGGKGKHFLTKSVQINSFSHFKATALSFKIALHSQ